MTHRVDHLIVGAGHNGLACAIELARRGRSVLVLEAADRVGGAAVTREFASGFKVSAAAHLLHGLSEQRVRDLDLEKHGLRFSARRMATVALNESGPPVVFSNGAVRGVSSQDAAEFARFSRRMSRFARLLARVNDTLPFRVSFASWRDRIDALKLALRIRTLGRSDMRQLLRIAAMNAYDLVSDSFDSNLMKGTLGFDATLGAEHGARAPGTVLTLLHRWAGQVDSGALGIAQPAGGMGALTQAMARAAESAGARIRTGARVQRILVQGDRAAGVVLDSGETVEAGSVISNADPKTTFLDLLSREHLDTDFVRRVSRFRSKGLVAKLHLALDGLPGFNGVEATALGSRLLVSPCLDYLELAFNPSKYREVPARPALEITVPTVNDPGLAPAGRHVMSIHVMFVPYDLGADPVGARARLLNNVLETLERYSPGLSKRIIDSELLTPADLEREFRISGGHWHHGALALDQFFITRPVPGATRYATPLPGLYLCGAGCHPGGGVMAVAGRNAALKVIAGGA
jgi:phytoene dehydrogenase-like protein